LKGDTKLRLVTDYCPRTQEDNKAQQKKKKKEKAGSENFEDRREKSDTSFATLHPFSKWQICLPV
jgi:hypothetical protein